MSVRCSVAGINHMVESLDVVLDGVFFLWHCLSYLLSKWVGWLLLSVCCERSRAAAQGTMHVPLFLELGS
jgi:hypothetical protein